MKPTEQKIIDYILENGDSGLFNVDKAMEHANKYGMLERDGELYILCGDAFVQDEDECNPSENLVFTQPAYRLSDACETYIIFDHMLDWLANTGDEMDWSVWHEHKHYAKKQVAV